MVERLFTNYFMINCEPEDESLLTDIFEKYEVEVLDSKIGTLRFKNQRGNYITRDRYICTIKITISSIWEELNEIFKYKDVRLWPVFIH